MITAVDNKNVAAETGRYIYPDGWDGGNGQLIDGDEYFPLRLESGRYTGISYPVTIKVTGHTIHRHRTYGNRIRVAITFYREDEPNTAGGWMTV